MNRTVLVYGRYHTTAYMFIHLLKHLLGHHAESVRDLHFHLILDDHRDLDLARSLLSGSRVTVEVQFANQRPFETTRARPADTVRRWEERYGAPNLRAYIADDRALQKRSEQAKWEFLFTQIEYFEERIARLKPAAFFSGAADGLSTWMAMAICKANGVRCVGFSPGRFGLRMFLVDNPYENLGIERRYRDLLSEDLEPETEEAVRGIREQYLKSSPKPIESQAVQANKRRPFPNPMSALRLIREGLTDARYYDQPLSAAFGRAIRARRTWFYHQYLSRHSIRTPVPGERYFFFPLQLEPESSLITMGRGWIDQLALVKLIAHCLPVDRWLYVKEHPAMLAGIRSLRFYRQIIALPNVRLVDQRVDSHLLIPHAEAVLTITGTAGWEGLMFGKPVVLFGRCFYEEFREGVISVDDPQLLPEILLSLRRRAVGEKPLLAYIAAVLERAPEGLLSEPRFLPAIAHILMDAQNLDRLARVFLNASAGNLAGSVSPVLGSPLPSGTL